ncbi:MAG: class I SAM-dependent methyltransferase [Actinobacteria bacterium]|nr:class I SAM-dependent methyltransferase [Actinomycetota bacterium]
MNLVAKVILKIISIIITPFIKDSGRRMVYLKFMQKLGFCALPQRYCEPVPLVSDIDSITKMPYLVMSNVPETEFEKKIEKKFLDKEYLGIFKKSIAKIAANKMFCGFDAFIYSEIIKNYNPKKIIEIGAGYSTFIAVHNINKNASINCIEPYPSEFLKELVGNNKNKISLIDKKIQDCYQDKIFSSLEQNDILFIDSTHVVLIGGDLPVIFLKILPIIRKGVLVHFHDVSIPYEYPRKLVYKSGRFYNELYMAGNLVANCNYSFIFGSYRFLLEKGFLNENDNYNFGLSVWLKK